MIAKINRLNKLAFHKDYKIHFKAFIEAVNGLFWVFNVNKYNLNIPFITFPLVL